MFDAPAAVDVRAAADEAATSPNNDLPEPTATQKQAGNYRKGHVSVQGLSLAIENPKGSVRRGTDPDGKEWSHAMSDHYGYRLPAIGRRLMSALFMADWYAVF